MSKSLANLSVSEAASLANELLIYGEYLEDQNGKYEWSTPFEGTFEDYLLRYWSKDGDYWYSEEDPGNEDKPELITEFDEQWIWQHFHSESASGSRDGITAKTVTSYGGEGEGDQYWSVISISDGLTTRHFRKDGWYASYDGGYLDGDTSEVKPREKTITVFE